MTKAVSNRVICFVKSGSDPNSEGKTIRLCGEPDSQHTIKDVICRYFVSQSCDLTIETNQIMPQHYTFIILLVHSYFQLANLVSPIQSY